MNCETDPPLPLVLVIEDDEQTRELLDELLATEGYRVLAVNDGREGLAAALALAVDLILLNLHLPELGGEDFCRAYREGGGAVPIILLTASGPDQIEAAIIACGAAGALRKPFDIGDVLESIARHVRRDGEASPQDLERRPLRNGMCSSSPIHDGRTTRAWRKHVGVGGATAWGGVQQR